MAKIYYIDTSIWIDYFENRKDNLRPIGEWAFELIRTAVKDKATILFSNIVEEELLRQYSKESIEKIFKIIGDKRLLIRLACSEKQLKEGKPIARQRSIPLHDVLHAILARDNSAILIARDKHFQELTDIVVPYKPEELI